MKKGNITLIGMAGAGKSTSGRKLAEKLGFEFIEVDDIIREKNNLPLSEIIEKFGEEKFSELEGEAVLSLGGIKNCVISTGGSVIYSEKTMEFLKDISQIIFLDIPFEVIESRLSNIKTRGIVGLEYKTLKQLYEERNPIYKKYADITINDDNSDKILKLIKQ